MISDFGSSILDLQTLSRRGVSRRGPCAAEIVNIKKALARAIPLLRGVEGCVSTARLL